MTATAQCSETVRAEQFLDAGLNAYYRDFTKAICGGSNAPAAPLVESGTFDEFLNKVGAKCQILADPFPVDFYVPPHIRLSGYGSHLDVTQSPAIAGGARYLVFTSKHVFMNPTAHEMFSRMHQDLLADLATSKPERFSLGL